MKETRTFLAANFALTREEKILLATILCVALTGLVARFVYLRGQKPEVYTPANLPAPAFRHVHVEE